MIRIDKNSSHLAIAALVLICGSARVASAQNTRFVAAVGATANVVSGDVPVWPIGATLGVDFALAVRHDLGFRLRGALIRTSPAAYYGAILASYRLHSRPRPTEIGIYLQLSVGVAMWAPAAVCGYSCQGLGLQPGMDTGIEYVLNENISFVFGASFDALVGFWGTVSYIQALHVGVRAGGS